MAASTLHGYGIDRMYRSALSLFLAASLCLGPAAAQTQLPPLSRPVSFDNSQRIHELVRAGSLYLSLQDALALAIENNLDIELQRFTLPTGDSELLRAQGAAPIAA